MEPTVAEFFGQSSIRHRPADKSDWIASFPIPLTYEPIDKSSLVGIEVEVENIRNYHFNFGPFWATTEDGSLKIYGCEFISIPVSGSHIEYALRQLYHQLAAGEDYSFSPRCSVHIHLNVRSLTFRQVRAICGLYLLFERGLFEFVGEGRDKNIHCVPLLDASITASSLVKALSTTEPLAGHWMKYSALNLLPLVDKGTIEFRHMHGTDDVDKLMQWIQIIIQIKNFVLKNNVEDLEQRMLRINTSSEYYQLLSSVFEKHLAILHTRTMLTGMEEGCTKFKQCLQSSAVSREMRRLEVGTKLYKLLGNHKAARTLSQPTVNWFNNSDVPMQAIIDELTTEG